jgi:hypothetical protein
MDIGKDEILELVRRSLTPEQIERSIIYWDNRVLLDGTPIKAGPQTFLMPYKGTVVFVDLAPTYNWAHPCLYICIDSTGKKAQLMKASFPPFFGTPDENYVILFRFGEIPPHERYFSVFDPDQPLKKGDENETE